MLDRVANSFFAVRSQLNEHSSKSWWKSLKQFSARRVTDRKRQVLQGCGLIWGIILKLGKNNIIALFCFELEKFIKAK